MIVPLAGASSASNSMFYQVICVPRLNIYLTQITYIEIPLAVLSVMPLLWNTVKSFIIRYRLLSSLPKQRRKEYSLIMDPAAGSVSVGVDTSKLHFEILWRSISPLVRNARWVSQCQNDLLGESWMGLDGIFPWYYGSRRRFVVDSDLRVEPIGMECDWNAFVHLSLALGVDPYDGGLLDLRRNMSTSFRDFVLKSVSGFPVMNVQKRENRVTASIIIRGAGGAALSIRTGLAWECGMIVIQASDVHVMMDREIQRDGTMPLEFGWATYHQHFGKQNSHGQETEKALIWVLYAESLYHESSRYPPQPLIPRKELSFEDPREFNVLRVTQQMLRIREDVVEELRLMADLENSLMEIFPTKRPLVESILATLHQEWSTSDVLFDNKRSARPYTDSGKRSFIVPEDPMIELLSEFEGYDPANPCGSDEHFVYLV